MPPTNYLADRLFCHLCDANSKVLNADGDDFSLGNSQLAAAEAISFEVKGEVRGLHCRRANRARKIKACIHPSLAHGIQSKYNSTSRHTEKEEGGDLYQLVRGAFRVCFYLHMSLLYSEARKVFKILSLMVRDNVR